MKDYKKPIKNQAEFDQVYSYLVDEAVKRLDIPREQAIKRIEALRKSGLLTELGPPDEQPFQIGVDVAMRIPQLEF